MPDPDTAHLLKMYDLGGTFVIVLQIKPDKNSFINQGIAPVRIKRWQLLDVTATSDRRRAL
jgi:hypothetical protein